MLCAADSPFSLPIAEIGERWSLHLDFVPDVWRNPANMRSYCNFSFTDIAVNASGGDYGSASVRQSGDKRLGWNVNAKSLLHLSSTESVMASASYENSHTKSVLWNNCSDVPIIYPYFTGDSVGGFLQCEQYAFSGGYARSFGKLTSGAEMSYRAESSWRNKDPRPQNVVSDFLMSLGANYAVADYRIGLAGSFRSYHQSGTISFLADKGAFSVYHMLGFGVDYVRYAGDYTSWKFRATQWSGSVSVIPVDGNGTYFALSASSMTLAKDLSSVNILPIVEVTDRNVSAQLAYSGICGNGLRRAVKIEGSFSTRKGWENIFGNGSATAMYQIINTVPGYGNRVYRIAAEAIAERTLTASSMGWGVKPCVAIRRIESWYATLSRRFDNTSLAARLQSYVSHTFGKMVMSATIAGGYESSLASQVRIDGLDQSSSSGQCVTDNLRFATDDCFSAGGSVCVARMLGRRGAVYLKMSAEFRHYAECGSWREGTASIGVMF